MADLCNLYGGQAVLGRDFTHFLDEVLELLFFLPFENFCDRLLVSGDESPPFLIRLPSSGQWHRVWKAGKGRQHF